MQTMRILHYSTDDVSGGAAKAAYRLHTALRAAGHQSQLIVQRKQSDDDDVLTLPPLQLNPWHARALRWRQRIPALRQELPRVNYMFNFNQKPQWDWEAFLAQDQQPADILCLHWITGLLDAAAMRRLYEHYRCPLVWVMADQEPMTGGCHYAFGCEGFTQSCGRCPQLASTEEQDYSRQTWEEKRRQLSGLPLCFVAPTSWGVKELKRSSLFGQHRVALLPYPIDTTTFRPLSPLVARDLLQLPADKKIIFFGATYLEDRRKGMTYLRDALGQLAHTLESDSQLKREDVFLLVAGLQGRSLLPQLPFAGKYVGHLNNELTLALAYQAADVFVCPSLEDAGPMMIPEALLCGTPTVAFAMGGAPDLIKTGETGYLAALGDAVDLARGLHSLLTQPDNTPMREAARAAAWQAHAPELVTERHLHLYQSLLAAHGNSPVH